LIEHPGNQILSAGKWTQGESPARIGDPTIGETVRQQRRDDQRAAGRAAGIPVHYLALESELRPWRSRGEGKHGAVLGPIVPQVGDAGEKLNPVHPIGTPSFLGSNRDPASLPADLRDSRGRRKDDELLQAAGSLTAIGSASLGDHLVKLELCHPSEGS
jgi:hypothetical protein